MSLKGNKQNRAQIIKTLAQKHGFSFCGIAKAEKLESDARKLEKWLSQGMHGQMHYMAGHFDLRIDPTKLVPGARSVISLMFNYFPSASQNPDAPKVSKYAYGKDYHFVIREKLNLLLQEAEMQIGQIDGRGFVDSAPVLERSWAVRSGLGWVGKNGNLIAKNHGSFYFLATLITDLDLEPDDPFAADYCGTCTRCLDACPTEAILPGKVVDGSKCISYFTIELKDMLLPEAYKGKFDNWMFGCDTCQDVCPWNRFSKAHQNNELQPISAIIDMSREEWENLGEEAFKRIFSQSALKRTKYKGIMRNLHFIMDDSLPDR